MTSHRLGKRESFDVIITDNKFILERGKRMNYQFVMNAVIFSDISANYIGQCHGTRYASFF